ncbi:MAG: hypothetical protein ACETWQ_16275 [Phycisphaerae bacterium]
MYHARNRVGTCFVHLACPGSLSPQCELANRVAAGGEAKSRQASEDSYIPINNLFLFFFNPARRPQDALRQRRDGAKEDYYV